MSTAFKSFGRCRSAMLVLGGILALGGICLVASAEPQKHDGTRKKNDQGEKMTIASEIEKDVYQLERELKWIEEMISRERELQPASQKYRDLDSKIEEIRREIARLELLVGGPNDEEVKPQIDQHRRTLQRLFQQYEGRISELLAEREEIVQKLKQGRKQSH